MSGRDYQRSACYRWEDKFVLPTDVKRVPFDQLQALVDYIWTQEGREHPPKIVRLPRQATRVGARATRLQIEVHESLPATILLHEIAHSMHNDVVENTTDAHGPKWLGTYMLLLSKHAGYDLTVLMYTARQAGLKFEF